MTLMEPVKQGGGMPVIEPSEGGPGMHDMQAALDFVRAEHNALRVGVGALVATSRCYRRPDSKLEEDPGPCGSCAVCIAKRAYYGSEWRER